MNLVVNLADSIMQTLDCSFRNTDCSIKVSFFFNIIKDLAIRTCSELQHADA